MEPKLDAFCRNWFIRLSPNFVCYILSSGRVKTQPELAFRFFNWAGSQKGGGCNYSHNLECYALLIDVLSGSKDVDRVKCVFNEVKNRGFVMNIKCANLLIKSFGNLGMVEELLWVWKEMKEHEIEPSLFTFNGRVCKSRAHRSDGFGKAGRLDEAEKLFEEMVNDGCSRDSYCYNALIDTLVKNDKVDEALALFNRMEIDGCDQTVYTYTIIMSGLFNKHRNEEALKIWDMMIDKGITPTPASFRVLSTGLCLSGKVSRACKILDALAPMGVVIDTACEDMINVLVKTGRVEQACKLADGIVERDREIPGRVRTVLINALRKSGNSEMAMKLMHSKIGIGYDRKGSVKKRVKFRVLVDK
ncbi:putative tetratricopeptide-like helical domain superfamily [Helianthus anomalus]